MSHLPCNRHIIRVTFARLHLPATALNTKVDVDDICRTVIVALQCAGAVAAEPMRLFLLLHNIPATGVFSLQRGAAASLLLAAQSHLLSTSPIAQSGAITARSFARTRFSPRLAGGAVAVRDTTVGMATMTSDLSSLPASSTPAENLGRYATQLCGEWSVEVPAAALKSLVPDLLGDHHKGQLGRVGVFGGSKDYTGAPFFASMSALRTGADLAYVLTAEEAAPALKAYSPELMVTPIYAAASLEGRSEELLEDIAPIIPKLHSLVLGPGLGRDPRVHAGVPAVLMAVRQRNVPIVMDADALFMMSVKTAATSMSSSAVAEQCAGGERVTAAGSRGGKSGKTGASSAGIMGSIQGYDKAVLTPNANEFRLLYRSVFDADPDLNGNRRVKGGDGGGGGVDGVSDAIASSREAVQRLAKELGGVTVVLKGREDILSDGKRTISCAVPGGLKRCGGIGDVLSGTLGTMLAWVSIQGFHDEEAEEMRLWAAWWACAVTKHASRRAYEAHGRAMSATHVMEHIGGVLEEIAPSPRVQG